MQRAARPTSGAAMWYLEFHSGILSFYLFLFRTIPVKRLGWVYWADVRKGRG